jgi:hypothetical protein
LEQNENQKRRLNAMSLINVVAMDAVTMREGSAKNQCDVVAENHTFQIG